MNTAPLITAREIAAVRRPFRSASLLPARAYHDPAVWDFEREQWFFTAWVCIGRAEDVAAPGTYLRHAVAVDDAVGFWDLTNGQDSHVVELQQRGTRSRSWVAGRYRRP